MRHPAAPHPLGAPGRLPLQPGRPQNTRSAEHREFPGHKTADKAESRRLARRLGQWSAPHPTCAPGTPSQTAPGARPAASAPRAPADHRSRDRRHRRRTSLRSSWGNSRRSSLVSESDGSATTMNTGSPFCPVTQVSIVAGRGTSAGPHVSSASAGSRSRLARVRAYARTECIWPGGGRAAGKRHRQLRGPARGGQLGQLGSVRRTVLTSGAGSRPSSRPSAAGGTR